MSSASEVTTLWRYTNLFFIIIIIIIKGELLMLAYQHNSTLLLLTRDAMQVPVLRIRILRFFSDFKKRNF